MNDQYLLHEHISNLEKRVKRVKNRTAPTVPIYDLSAVTSTASVRINTLRGNNGPFASVALGTWYHIDSRYTPGIPIGTALFVNGVNQGVTSTFPDTGLINGVGFGVSNSAAWMTAFEFYVGNIKVGTSLGASDKWNGDISLGLVAFSSTYIGAGQTLEVIIDPTAMTTKVLHVKVTNDADYVLAQKDFSNSTDLWMSFDIYFVAQLPPDVGDFAGELAMWSSQSGFGIDGINVSK